MWFGILAALLLCFATAISYAELSSSFRAPGSSYLVPEQAFLSGQRTTSLRGWQILHRFGEPPVLLGLSRLHGGSDAILGGYLLSQLMPDTFSGN